MYAFRKKILFALFFTAAASGVASAIGTTGPADLDAIRRMEDSMVITADSMYGAFLPDTRIVYSERFARQLVRALRVDNSYTYTFPKLAGKINIVEPSDKAFRIFNWDIAPTDDTRRYYGAIQVASEKLKLFGLVDYSKQMSGKGAEDSVLSRGKWLGALYYRIIPHEVDGKKVYSLFGLNAANRLSNRKILEPMMLEEDGPVFGAPIVNVTSELRPGTRVNRFILEFKKDVSVKMNWNDEYKCVIFDNLVSQTNDPGRKYTYVPSGQMDGLRWSGSGWDYVQNVVEVVPRKDGEAPIGEPR